jgi:Xaa-Pro aminopeptidase
LDKAARDFITQAGYGKYFGHALGHGVGLEIHERPVLSGGCKDMLKPGMVFTIEPGIYLPGWGGVRIEDVYECTKTGARQLSHINKILP